MQPLLIARDERFGAHLEKIPHLESPKRIKAIHAVLDDPSLKGKWREVRPREATVEELALVHTPDYIARVASTAGKALTSFDLDTQASEKSYAVARLGVGAVFNLLEEIQAGNGRRGFACIRPPGHHAEPDKAMGFCLFNNVALGARYLTENGMAGRVMIVDIDLHHGNGTQAAFYERDDVLFVSMHQFPCYPGTGNYGEVGRGKGEGFTVNVPLRKGLGDEDFARIIYFLVNPLAQAYEPDMILVSCGFDLYHHDPLGGMNVTPEGYGLITFLLLGIAEKVCEGRIAFVMEGGYSLRGIRECGLRVIQELCGISNVRGRSMDRVVGSSPKKLPALSKVKEVHGKYWKVLR
ncbi:MAG: histone deacetylase [Desulfobacterales bacterium]|nr:histone deacetylase [Desulfobacterales bacterium]